MPKRPLSAYNLFFQYEREQLIIRKDQEHAEAMDTSATDDRKPAAAAAAGGTTTTTETDQGFGSARTSSASSSSDANNNGALEIIELRSARRHTRGIGIGFAELAKIIAAKWKGLDKESRSTFEQRAATEKARYNKEMAVWRQKQKDKADQAKAQEQKIKADGTLTTTTTTGADASSDISPTGSASSSVAAAALASASSSMPKAPLDPVAHVGTRAVGTAPSAAATAAVATDPKKRKHRPSGSLSPVRRRSSVPLPSRRTSADGREAFAARILTSDYNAEMPSPYDQHVHHYQQQQESHAHLQHHPHHPGQYVERDMSPLRNAHGDGEWAEPDDGGSLGSSPDYEATLESMDRPHQPPHRSYSMPGLGQSNSPAETLATAPAPAAAIGAATAGTGRSARTSDFNSIKSCEELAAEVKVDDKESEGDGDSPTTALVNESLQKLKSSLTDETVDFLTQIKFD